MTSRGSKSGSRTLAAARFGISTPIVGMVHLPPLPGAPGWRGTSEEIEAVEARALADAEALEEGGLDGLLVENFGDAPFHPKSVPPETVAAMARVAAVVERSVSIPVGVNVLRNDARAALAVAVAAGADFIRVNVHAGVMFTDQGVLEGRAHDTLRLRSALGADMAILADVHVKHAVAPPGQSLENAARDLWQRAGADGLIVSGPGTGRAADPDAVRAVRNAVPDAPVWIGSGVTLESAPRFHALCDGMIVGSALQAGERAGGGVEAARVSAFMEAVEPLR